MAEGVTVRNEQTGEPRLADAAAGPLAEAISIMARLRGPGGCPWDREQTFDTIKRHTLEETYEVFDAIERRAWPDLKDELGDLLLQVLFYAQMAAEAGYFDIGDVAAESEREADSAASARLSGDPSRSEGTAFQRPWSGSSSTGARFSRGWPS